jgi:tetratricopeptide (TPR) repeat protein
VEDAGLGHDYPLDAAIAIRWLVEAGVLVALPEADRYAFRTAVVREAILRAIPAELAQPIHDAAYRYHRATGLPASLPALAFHAAQRGLKHEAFATYVALAEQAAGRHAYLDAELFLGRALEQEGHGEDPIELARVLRERGLLRYRLTRYDEARRDLGRARELAAGQGSRALELAVDLDEATVLDWMEEWHASRDLVERARRLAGELDGGPGPLLEARLAMGLGRSACRFAEYEDAARLLLDAAARSDGLGDEAYETLVIALLLGGWVLATLGRLEESRAAFDRVVPLTTARHDQLHLGAALACRNTLWAALNQPQQAADDLGVLLGITRELGNVRLECAARQLLALSLHVLGRYAEAEVQARRAIEVDDRLMGAAARLESRIYLARILAVAGKTAEAAEVLDDVHARRETSRASGGGELLPMEATMLAFVELLVRGGDVAAWNDLEARARKDLNGQDLEEALRLIAERRAAGG